MQIQETKIKDLTVEELRNIIRETVLETLESYQDDLAENLTIKKDVEQQLLAIKKRRDSQKTSISASEVYKQLGIND
jgi:uncharacterized protein with gpF-like domain